MRFLPAIPLLLALGFAPQAACTGEMGYAAAGGQQQMESFP
jgi:hypothetical protein